MRTFSNVRALIDASLTFPFLRVLSLGPICDVDILFLQRLPKLEDLDLQMHEISTNTHMPGSFHQLMCYFGMAQHIPHIIPGSAVRIACISCNILLKERWIELMVCLRQSTVPIEHFQCGPQALQIDMILAIPDYLPDLRVLHLTQIVRNLPVCGCPPFVTC